MFDLKKTRPIENSGSLQETSCHEHKDLKDLKILNMEEIMELGVGYEPNPYVFVHGAGAWPRVEGVCTKCSAVVRKSMISDNIFRIIVDELRKRLTQKKPNK